MAGITFYLPVEIEEFIFLLVDELVTLCGDRWGYVLCRDRVPNLSALCSLFIHIDVRKLSQGLSSHCPHEQEPNVFHTGG